MGFHQAVAHLSDDCIIATRASSGGGRFASFLARHGRAMTPMNTGEEHEKKVGKNAIMPMVGPLGLDAAGRAEPMADDPDSLRSLDTFGLCSSPNKCPLTEGLELPADRYKALKAVFDSLETTGTKIMLRLRPDKLKLDDSGTIAQAMEMPHGLRGKERLRDFLPLCCLPPDSDLFPLAPGTELPHGHPGDVDDRGAELGARAHQMRVFVQGEEVDMRNNPWSRAVARGGEPKPPVLAVRDKDGALLGYAQPVRRWSRLVVAPAALSLAAKALPTDGLSADRSSCRTKGPAGARRAKRRGSCSASTTACCPRCCGQRSARHPPAAAPPAPPSSRAAVAQRTRRAHSAAARLRCTRRCKRWARRTGSSGSSSPWSTAATPPARRTRCEIWRAAWSSRRRVRLCLPARQLAPRLQPGPQEPSPGAASRPRRAGAVAEAGQGDAA